MACGKKVVLLHQRVERLKYCLLLREKGLDHPQENLLDEDQFQRKYLCDFAKEQA